MALLTWAADRDGFEWLPQRPGAGGVYFVLLLGLICAKFVTGLIYPVQVSYYLGLSGMAQKAICAVMYKLMCGCGG